MRDVLSDGLNQMMNALRAGKNSVTVRYHSKLLISVLALAKLKGYVKSYNVENNNLTIVFDKLNACNAIKPRFLVSVSEIDAHIKRFLPAKDLGIIIVSTSKGLMTHQTAMDKNMGGSLIAYFY